MIATFHAQTVGIIFINFISTKVAHNLNEYIGNNLSASNTA